MLKPDIVPVVEEAGVKLRRAGRNLVGLCPFHYEKTPSFSVSPAKQVFHCFSCGEGGDVIAFAQKKYQLTFPDALAFLGINRKRRRRNIQVDREKLLRGAYEKKKTELYNRLCLESRDLHKRKAEIKANRACPEEEGWRRAEKLASLDLIDAKLDIFSEGDEEQVFELIKAEIGK